MAGAGSVVLMSGGIESAALLYQWRSMRLHPLYINYGQRGAAMEEHASDKICTQLGLHLNHIDMSTVGDQFRDLQEQARAFVPLPHRNLVILGLAASFATQVGSNEVVLGLNKEDLGSYSRTGMAGVPGTASDIFDAVKGVGANVVMISQASNEHSVCFAVPEKEADLVRRALERKFRRDLDAGRLSKVEVMNNCCILAAVGQRMASTPRVSATLWS